MSILVLSLTLPFSFNPDSFAAMMRGTPGDDDNLDGTEKDDAIYGLAGNDEIVGFDGNAQYLLELAQTLFMDRMGKTILREIRGLTYYTAKTFAILTLNLMTTKRMLSKEMRVMTS